MEQVTTIGLDLAKRVFQVHGVNASGQVVLRRQLRRRQVVPFFAKLAACRVGLEACGTAHHWGRQLQGLGHDVRLIPPAYAKAYVRRNKTDPAAKIHPVAGLVPAIHAFYVPNPVARDVGARNKSGHGEHFWL